MPDLDKTFLLDAFQLPPEKVVKFIEEKGYRISWNWKEVWQQAHTRAFTVAKVLKMDILVSIREQIERAIKEGITLNEFQKTLEPILKREGWWGKQEIVNPDTGETEEVQLGSPWRLSVIYRTNLQTAYMAGRYQGQMESERQHLQFIALIDSRSSNICPPFHLMVFPRNDAFWNSFYPPNHFGCRSRVRSISESAIKRYGYDISSSEGKLGSKQVPIGKGQTAGVTTFKIGERTITTAPGFSYNPGQHSYAPDLLTYPKELVKQYKKEKEKKEFSAWLREIVNTMKSSTLRITRKAA